MANAHEAGDRREVAAELLGKHRARKLGRGGWHLKDTRRQRNRREWWRQSLHEQNRPLQQRLQHYRAGGGHGFKVY